MMCYEGHMNAPAPSINDLLPSPFSTSIVLSWEKRIVLDLAGAVDIIMANP